MRAWIYSVFVTLALISASVAAEERAVHAACRNLEDVPKALELLDRDDVHGYVRFMVAEPNSCFDLRLLRLQPIPSRPVAKMYGHKAWDVWQVEDRHGNRAYTWQVRPERGLSS